jgi:hypothetical protein
MGVGVKHPSCVACRRFTIKSYSYITKPTHSSVCIAGEFLVKGKGHLMSA